MYHLKNTIGNVYDSSIIEFEEDSFFVILKVEARLVLTKFNYNAKMLDQVLDKEIFQIYRLDERRLILTSKDCTESYIMIDGKLVTKFGSVLISCQNVNNREFSAYVKNNDESQYCIIDKESLKIRAGINYTAGYCKYFPENGIFLQSLKGLVKAFDDNEKLLWQMDFSETYATNDVFLGSRKGQIGDTMVCGDEVLVLVGSNLLLLSLNDGRILLDIGLEFPISGKFFKYKGKILILGSGVVGYNIYDPKLKSISNKIQINGFLENDNDYGLSASLWCFYNDYLWFVSNNYRGYIGAIEPFTGKRVDCIIPENSISLLGQVYINNDKLFVSDGNSVLYMYDKK
jgi:hypothetical protein